ncbi:MAG: glycoside hydrolase [Acidobacteria bacterium]|nr:glycoside hydrolase [Acidobacteriota bacterium]
MPDIHLCFLWHMHQPLYKDLMSGEYWLPWTRMHALKDYYGMVKVLEEFPDVHQTFNLVPSLMLQLEDYASERASDPFLRCALKPAETLTDSEQEFILQYFFQADTRRLIYRYPRYGQLLDAWLAADKNFRRARASFDAPALRDLQVLSQLAWMDEEYQAHDPVVRELVRKGRDYSPADQAALGRKQVELIRAVLPTYREFADRGQIELSTTPFYHPILPLLCDSSIAQVSHPHVPLPSRFRFPEDARHQLATAREYFEKVFGRPPAGLWPSEGSVSDEALGIASDAGFRWAATDNGVLSRTIERHASPEVSYQPYQWRQGSRAVSLIFRDHYLSDLVGFVYSKMGAREAACHLIEHIEHNCGPILGAGRDALVPIILDGENAWEHYEMNGRPFLRELYSRISAAPHIHALTVSEALERVQAVPVGHIFPGSWINANFDVWIGAEEDNRAWEQLLRARETYERIAQQPGSVPDDRVKLAFEELLIAEGSDWCWWYGPEHDCANRPEFDQLFRTHLTNVYRALGLTPPEELSRPILKSSTAETHDPPSAPIEPRIDGEITSYFEWMGAGVYRCDGRSGSMHGGARLVREMHYGASNGDVFIRLDFEPAAANSIHGAEVRLTVNGQPLPCSIRIESGHRVPHNCEGAEAAFRKIFELRLPVPALESGPVQLQVSLWRDGLPLQALPAQGSFEVAAEVLAEWPV